jgi:hypothetical protein
MRWQNPYEPYPLWDAPHFTSSEDPSPYYGKVEIAGDVGRVGTRAVVGPLRVRRARPRTRLLVGQAPAMAPRLVRTELLKRRVARVRDALHAKGYDSIAGTAHPEFGRFSDQVFMGLPPVVTSATLAPWLAATAAWERYVSALAPLGGASAGSDEAVAEALGALKRAATTRRTIEARLGAIALPASLPVVRDLRALLAQNRVAWRSVVSLASSAGEMTPSQLSRLAALCVASVQNLARLHASAARLARSLAEFRAAAPGGSPPPGWFDPTRQYGAPGPVQWRI